MEILKQAERPLVIYAHPDDEVIACAFAISELRDRVNVVYATNGMPSPITDSDYYRPHTKYEYGYAYSQMRRNEAKTALSILGLEDGSRVHFLDFPDSDLIHHMQLLNTKIKDLIEKLQPDLIITGAYEGGHIDHDLLTATIWHCTDKKNVVICETPIYSLGRKGKIMHNHVTSRHRDWNTADILNQELSIKKRKAFIAYASQHLDLKYFKPDAHEFYHFSSREASLRADFTKVPNEGEILYALELGSPQFSDFQSGLESSISSFVKA